MGDQQQQRQAQKVRETTAARPQPRDMAVGTIEPALKVGVACGVAGFIFGGASGIIRGLPPGLAGGASALQTFALGSTFSATRNLCLHAWVIDSNVPADGTLTSASAVAGGVSGGLVGLLARGRSNALPGAIMFCLFGAGGQYVVNRWNASTSTKPKENFWQRMGSKSWTPFRMLTNDEYLEMLREKMLKLDVEIAVIDDKMAALKEQQMKEKQSESLNQKSRTH